MVNGEESVERSDSGPSHGGRVPGPSLRSQLMGGLAVLLFVALFTLAIAVIIAFRLDADMRSAVFWLVLVILFDVALLVWFADYRLRQLVLRPVDRMVEGAERIAAGDESGTLEGGGASELRRLSGALNEMADRLIRHQQALAANIRSLDATNRALTETRNELVQAEKLASIGRLAAGVAHEIGNPLGAILGYIELGRRKGDANRAWVDGVAHEAERIDRIVRGLLDYARPKAAAPREVDVNEVVGRTVELLTVQGRLKKVRVEVKLGDDLPAVRADPFQLEQVLVNLLLNASDAVEQVRASGVIGICTARAAYRTIAGATRTRRRDDPAGTDYSHLRRFGHPEEVRGSPFEEGEPIVEIAVTDDGAGIDPEHVHRVFDPFFTTKEPGRGTGLGLAVSARLVDGMGGTIQARQREGGGAIFTLMLPIADREGEE
ncbi:MAG: sensor histidine kinase [Gemmatimonadota bacterium]